MSRTYFLPWPPQANNRLVVRGGRAVLSAKVRKWYEHAAQELGLQRPKMVEGPVELYIKLVAPWNRKYDIDNRAKCTIDALVKNGILEGDDCTIVRKLTLEASEDGTVGAWVTILSLMKPDEKKEAA